MSPAETRPSRRVLVLGNDTRAFLSVIRSLGRQGLDVHVGWCDPRSPAARSRYVSQVHEIPPPSPKTVEWRDRLREILGRENFDLVIPCNDPSILPLQRCREELDPFCRSIYLLDDVAFRIAFDKLASYDLAKSLGLSVARHIRLSCLAELPAALPSLTWPVVVKPRTSFTPDRLGRKHHVRLAHSPDELERRVQELLPWGELALEECFTGHGVGVEVLAYQGQVLVPFQHVRLHEPPTGGGSSYRRSTELHPELFEATTTFLHALRYTGVAMMEFKLNPDTGQWVFIEINGRFWGSLPLALAAGVDFPYYLYQMWVEGRRHFPRAYRTGVSCRNLVKDLDWITKRWLTTGHDPPFATLSRRRPPLGLVELLTLREHSDTFVFDDPRPGFVELRQLGRPLTRSVAKIATRLLYSRPRLWRHRTTRTRQALQHARRLLFVCKGNICRGAFADHLARTVFPSRLHVASCGYHDEPGRRCPAEAVHAAGELGVDLRPHRSRVLTPAMLEDADIVFVFDEDNLVTLRERYPWAMPKVHLLGVLGDRDTAIIRDPYGGTPTEFRVAFEAIRRSVTAALRWLPAGAGVPAAAGRVSTSSGALGRLSTRR